MNVQRTEIIFSLLFKPWLNWGTFGIITMFANYQKDANMF